MRYLLLPSLLLTFAAPAFADDADEIKAIEALRPKLPDARKGELAARMAKLKNLEDGFHTLIEYAAEEDTDGSYDWAAYTAYLAEFRKLRPDHPAGFFYAAKLAAPSRPDEARALFRKTLEKAPAALLPRYFEPSLLGAAYVGHDLDAYAAAPATHRREAFRLLSEKLCRGLFWHGGVEVGIKETRDRLDTLVARHAAAEPTDPRVSLVRGVVAQQDRDWSTADEQYAKYLAAVGKPDYRTGDWGTAFYGRVEVNFRRGRGVEIYRELAPRNDAEHMKSVFERLAELYERGGDAKGYEGLLAEHAARRPTDPELAYHRGNVWWVKKEYSKAADEFRAYLEPAWASAAARRKLRYGHTSYNGSGAAERLVRSLLRSGRAKEVPGVAAKTPGVTDSFGWLATTAAATAGDVAAASRAATRPGVSVAVLYGDPDLGPILRSPALAAFRAAHPEPR